GHDGRRGERVDARERRGRRLDADDQVAPHGAAREYLARARERLEIPVAPDVARAADAALLQHVGVEQLEVVAERVDAHRVRAVDPARLARRVDLRGDERVEVAAYRLDVGREERDAAVVGVVVRGVEIDELRDAFVERGAHGLEHVLDRRRPVRPRRRARAFEAEAARRSADAEPARAARRDEQVVPVERRDAPHRRAARRPPLVEARLRKRADGEPLRAGGVAVFELEAPALADERERRGARPAVVDGRAHPDVAREDEVERAGDVLAERAAAREPGRPDGGTEGHAVAREAQLERPGVAEGAHVDGPQRAQPGPSSGALATRPVARSSVSRRPRAAGSTTRRTTSCATRPAATSAAGAASVSSSGAGGVVSATAHATQGRPASVTTAIRGPTTCADTSGRGRAAAATPQPGASPRATRTSASPGAVPSWRATVQSGHGSTTTSPGTASAPTPARAQSAATIPTSSASPASATRAARSRSCPRPPTSGMMIWRL